MTSTGEQVILDPSTGEQVVVDSVQSITPVVQAQNFSFVSMKLFC